MTPSHAFLALLLSITIHLVVITHHLTTADTTTYSSPSPAPMHVDLNYTYTAPHLATKSITPPPASTERPDTGSLPSINPATNSETKTNRKIPLPIINAPKNHRVAHKIANNPAQLEKTSHLEETAKLKTGNPIQAERNPIEPRQTALQRPSVTFTEASTTTPLNLRYPPFSRRRGEEGIVTLSIGINEHGKVDFVDIIHSSGHTRLDKAAHLAALKATYTPAKRNHRAIASTKQLEINFRLNDITYN